MALEGSELEQENVEQEQENVEQNGGKKRRRTRKNKKSKQNKKNQQQQNGGKKKGKKGKGTKKRKVSAYNLFMKSELAKVKKANPKMDHKAAFTAAAQNWSKKKK